MVRYIGLDVHKRFIEVCILDESGKPVFRGKTGCLREEIQKFAQAKLKRTDQVALEATTNTWPVVEPLRPLVAMGLADRVESSHEKSICHSRAGSCRAPGSGLGSGCPAGQDLLPRAARFLREAGPPAPGC